MSTLDEVMSLINEINEEKMREEKEEREAKERSYLTNPLTVEETKKFISELYNGRSIHLYEGEPRYLFAMWFIRNQKDSRKYPYYLSYFSKCLNGKNVMSVSLIPQ
jgi:hypothetical protein